VSDLSAAERRFFAEISSLLDKRITVTTRDGKKLTGVLLGVHLNSLSLCLGDVKDESGNLIHRLILTGGNLAQIQVIEKPFDLKGLAERLEKVFPTLVRLYEDKGFIIVANKVKVTEEGVVEGTGSLAEKVQHIYEQFVRETKGS